MSGGGGGGGGDWRPEPTPIRPAKPGGGGGNGGGNGNDPCDLVEVTNLNSVNANALASLAVGAVLDVVYQPGPPARLLAQNGGTIVGSITSPSMPQIIQCIGQQNTYRAEVVMVQNGMCRVEIRRV